MPTSPPLRSVSVVFEERNAACTKPINILSNVFSRLEDESFCKIVLTTRPHLENSFINKLHTMGNEVIMQALPLVVPADTRESKSMMISFFSELYTVSKMPASVSRSTIFICLAMGDIESEQAENREIAAKVALTQLTRVAPTKPLSLPMSYSLTL